MALIIKKHLTLFTLILLSVNAFANVIYQPNDIPLLDNRFRIDPNTKEVTIILNHPKKAQKAVIVKPDGSKWYEQRHPKNVAWLKTRDQDIITIQNPIPGPWQAIAQLNGENRIQLLNPISLHVDRFPVRVYRNEYLTTRVSLMENDRILTDKNFLRNAKLTVSLIGKAKKLISLYKDDGENYDTLPFDGQLTADMFINLIPGRYSFSVKTRNNIFVRAYNQDIVIFPPPITFNTEQLEHNAAFVKFTFIVDSTEIDPDSVTIDGLMKSYNQNNTKQSIIHLAEHKARNNIYTIKVPLKHDLYTYTAKMYATTKTGREIVLQLPERTFELLAPYVPEEVDAAAEQAKAAALKLEHERKEEQYRLLIMLIIGLILLIATIVVVAILFIKRKQKNLTTEDGLSLDELTVDELQPTSIDINDDKN